MARVEVRLLTATDLPALSALCEGRNVSPEEYERFLGLEGAAVWGLWEDGGLVGAVSAIRYFEHAFLGPVLAAPQADGVAYPVALLTVAVQALQRAGVPQVDAAASPSEQGLLAGLGFAETGRAIVLERDATAPAAPSRATRPLDPADFLDVGSLDAAVVGYGRKEYLVALRDAAPHGARVRGDEGAVTGYVLLRRARRGHHVGPLVTRSADAAEAEALLDDALAEAAEGPVVALAPQGGPLVPSLEARGFREVGRLTRMRAGAPIGKEGEATEWLLGSRLTG